MQAEVQVSNKIRLSHARTQLGISQQRLCDLAGLAIGTMVRAEKGGPIQLLTAQAILNALNAIRAERNLTPFGLSDLEWTVQGE
jgi:transcriptional regulator with XRE-family HTH domain